MDRVQQERWITGNVRADLERLEGFLLSHCSARELFLTRIVHLLRELTGLSMVPPLVLRCQLRLCLRLAPLLEVRPKFLNLAVSAAGNALYISDEPLELDFARMASDLGAVGCDIQTHCVSRIEARG